MITFKLPKNAAVDDVLEELTEHFSQFGWEIVDSDSDSCPDDDAFATKKAHETLMMGSLSYSVEIIVYMEEDALFYNFHYRTFVNISGVRREDIEDIDYVRDKEIKEMLIEKEALGNGIGPKTFKNMVKSVENKLMRQAYKVLNLYCRNQDDF